MCLIEENLSFECDKKLLVVIEKQLIQFLHLYLCVLFLLLFLTILVLLHLVYFKVFSF